LTEIYDGTGLRWDYGSVGVDLRSKIMPVWRWDFVQQDANMVCLDASIDVFHGEEGERARGPFHRSDGGLPTSAAIASALINSR
jgi:hypothetical protein